MNHDEEFSYSVRVGSMRADCARPLDPNLALSLTPTLARALAPSLTRSMTRRSAEDRA